MKETKHQTKSIEMSSNKACVRIALGSQGVKLWSEASLAIRQENSKRNLLCVKNQASDLIQTIFESILEVSK